MSNLETTPEESTCAARAGAGIEVLEPREVPLGGLRAMPVRRTLPQRSRSLIGAWCFLDHYGPDDVAQTGGMNVAAHPHTGLQTVSWLFSGTIEHRDSAGSHATVRPGEINLMTAGSGISHSERSTPDTTVLHGAQLWVALPAAARGTGKRFESYAPPLRTGEGFEARVFLGSLLGDTSPVATHTELVGAEIVLKPGARIRVPVNRGHEHGVLVDTGEVSFSREGTGAGDAPDESPTPLEAHALGFAPRGADALLLAAGGAGARLLLLGGEPFEEELVMWWNFIGGSHEEIAEAREAWQQTVSGAAEHDRYGLPDGEPEPPLPAPPLPAARLKPRGHLPPLPATSGTRETAAPEEIRIAHAPERRRYEVTVDGVLAGFAGYRPTASGARAFDHTEISPEYGGRGLAGRLVSEALADTRAAGLRVVPYCPFVAAWLRKHPEYEEIIDWPSP